MKNEIRSLTGIRGIAAMYVLVFHFLRELLTAKYQETPSTAFLYVKNIVAHGYLGVDVFFMLSAFVLTLRYGNNFSKKVDCFSYWHFMKKRFQRLYLPYIICVITAMFIIKSYSPIVFFIEALFLQVFTDVNLYNFNIATWSLSVEWIIYLIFPFFLLIVQRFHFILHLLFLILSICLLYWIQFLETHVFSVRSFSMITIQPSLDLNVHFGFLAIVRALAIYYLGFIVFRYHRYLNNNILFISSIVIICFLMIGNYNDVWIVLAFCLFLAGILKQNIISKFLQFSPIHYLGKISYSLYLFHLIVFNTMNKFQWINFENNAFAFIAISTVVSVVIAIFSYELIEKKASQFLFNKNY